MKHALIRRLITLLVISLATSPVLSICASAMDSPALAAVQSGSQSFSAAELDELLGPVALYPDPLLAQVLPAATFVDQISEAVQLLNGRTDNGLIDRQNWDVSVKSIAHYPAVLSMMSQKRDWAITLGQAYVNQSTDVIKSVQRLRAEARAVGSLITTPQQQVIVDGQTIKIVPAQPQVIYVPQYNPEVVYVKEEHGVSTGTAVAAAAISFGAGLAIGAWLNRDWDWHGGGIFYHGWSGGGWIGANRTFVNVNRNIYVNNSFRNVNVNRTVVNRNVTSYRSDLNRRVNVNNRNIDATRRNTERARSDSLRNTSNDRLDAHRGRDNSRQIDSRNQGSTRQVSDNRGRQFGNGDSHSAFGGIGSKDNARQEHDRGADSRQKMGASHDGGMRRQSSDRGGAKAGGGRRGGRRP
jgi:uncharacterized protein DUF3300